MHIMHIMWQNGELNKTNEQLINAKNKQQCLYSNHIKTSTGKGTFKDVAFYINTCHHMT